MKRKNASILGGAVALCILGSLFVLKRQVRYEILLWPTSIDGFMAFYKALPSNVTTRAKAVYFYCRPLPESKGGVATISLEDDTSLEFIQANVNSFYSRPLGLSGLSQDFMNCTKEIKNIEFYKLGVSSLQSEEIAAIRSEEHVMEVKKVEKIMLASLELSRKESQP